MTREGEREIVKVEKPSGGEGYILKEADVYKRQVCGRIRSRLRSQR